MHPRYFHPFYNTFKLMYLELTPSPTYCLFISLGFVIDYCVKYFVESKVVSQHIIEEVVNTKFLANNDTAFRSLSNNLNQSPKSDLANKNKQKFLTCRILSGIILQTFPHVYDNFM